MRLIRPGGFIRHSYDHPAPSNGPLGKFSTTAVLNLFVVIAYSRGATR